MARLLPRAENLTAAILLLLAAGTASAQDEATRALREKVRTVRCDLDLRDQTLDAFAGYLSDMFEINVVVTPRALALDARITFSGRRVPVAAVLDLVLPPHKLAWKAQEGVIRIAEASELQAEVRTVMIDVRDLMMPIRDFPGIELTLEESGLSITTMDDAGPPEIPLEDLIKAHTGGTTWEDNPKASVRLANGVLFVRQSGEVLREIRTLLNLLRRNK